MFVSSVYELCLERWLRRRGRVNVFSMLERRAHDKTPLTRVVEMQAFRGRMSGNSYG
jgi:hypothetical protein